MSAGTLHRRLSRLEAAGPFTAPLACTHGEPAFVMPGEPYVPCPVCHDEGRMVIRIQVIDVEAFGRRESAINPEAPTTSAR